MPSLSKGMGRSGDYPTGQKEMFDAWEMGGVWGGKD